MTTTTVPAPSLPRRTAMTMAAGAFALGAALSFAVVVLDDDGASTDSVQPAITGAEYEASADARKEAAATFQAESSLLDRSISAVDHADAGSGTSLLDRSISAVDHADAGG